MDLFTLDDQVYLCRSHDPASPRENYQDGSSKLKGFPKHSPNHPESTNDLTIQGRNMINSKLNTQDNCTEFIEKGQEISPAKSNVSIGRDNQPITFRQKSQHFESRRPSQNSHLSSGIQEGTYSPLTSKRYQELNFDKKRNSGTTPLHSSRRKNAEFDRLIRNADSVQRRIEQRLKMLNESIEKRSKNSSSKKNRPNIYQNSYKAPDQQLILESIPPKIQPKSSSNQKIQIMTQKLQDLVEMMDVVCGSPLHKNLKKNREILSAEKIKPIYGDELRNSSINQNSPSLKIHKYDPLGLQTSIGDNTLDQYIRTLDYEDEQHLNKDLGTSDFSIINSKLLGNSSILKEQLAKLNDNQKKEIRSEFKRRKSQSKLTNNQSKTIDEEEFYTVRPSIEPSNLMSQRSKIQKPSTHFDNEYSTILPSDSVSKNFYTRNTNIGGTFGNITHLTDYSGSNNRTLTKFSQNPQYNRKHLQNCLVCIQCLRQNTDIIESKLKEVTGHCEMLVNIMSLNLDSMEKGLNKLKMDYFIETDKDQKLLDEITIFIVSIAHCKNLLEQNKGFGYEYLRLMISGIQDIFKKTSIRAIELISNELGIEKFERMSLSPRRKASGWREPSGQRIEKISTRSSVSPLSKLSNRNVRGSSTFRPGRASSKHSKRAETIRSRSPLRQNEEIEEFYTQSQRLSLNLPKLENTIRSIQERGHNIPQKTYSLQKSPNDRSLEIKKYNQTHQPKIQGCTDPKIIFNFTDSRQKRSSRPQYFNNEENLDDEKVFRNLDFAFKASTVTQKECSRQHQRLTLGSGKVNILKLIDNENVVIGYDSGDVVIFHLLKQEESFAHRIHTSAITALEVTNLNLRSNSGLLPTQVLITGTDAEECSVMIWNISSKRPMKRLNGHRARISAILSLEDNATICTSSYDSKIAI